MKLRVQVIIESEGGETTVQEVAHVERGAQRMEQLGLSLNEGKALLQDIQRAMVREQVRHYVVNHNHCADCGTPRGRKGEHAIVYRTVFGTLRVSSPRLYECRCRERAKKSTSPLAELITERTAPELLYLENRFAAVMSFEAAETLLQEVLPLSGTISVAGIHRTVQDVAERLDSELGPERAVFIDGCQREWDELPVPGPPLTVGLDGRYVHAKQQRSRHAGWFEVIASKSVVAFKCAEAEDIPSAKRFAFVQTYDTKPRRRVWELMKSQGLQENQEVVFLSDGGETVRNLQAYLHPSSEHYLDWFHVTMRLTVMTQQNKALIEEDASLGTDVQDTLESVKHYLWHGNVEAAFERLERLLCDLDLTHHRSHSVAKLCRSVSEFDTDIRNNRAFIPNVGERYRQGETISTAFVESTINQVVSTRFVKKQQMQWTPEGAHLLLQTRTKVLDGDLDAAFRDWYPQFRQAAA
ncbi:MAG: ISKra4 family transposase [Nitrospira sp.]|nr:ISKra4 family transposase [Nitrospira sp.]MDH4371190.1 ISKra4 family transposase [Nitrospira sp.]